MSVIIFLYIAYWVLRILAGLFGSGDTGSLNQEEYRPQIQLKTESKNNLQLLLVEYKGIIPTRRERNIAFVTTIFDTTDKPKPVISHHEHFQEKNTVVFQDKREAGVLGPGSVATDWVTAGIIPLELLSPPYGGKRKLTILLWMIDLNNPPAFQLGITDREQDSVIFVQEVEYSYTFKQKGYVENKDAQRDGKIIILKIGMFVAHLDEFSDDEGSILQEWMKRIIATYQDEEYTLMKDALNSAFKESFELAKNGRLMLSSLCRDLNNLEVDSLKYDAMKLCYDVLAADGVASPNEIRVLKQISEALQIDPEKEASIRDRIMANINKEKLDTAEDGEVLLGINKAWDAKQKKAHLRKEFQKWNNRVNVVSGKEREEAERMLDLIAKIRKKYE